MPFPITATRPGYWVELHAQDRHANVFYQGETVTLPLVDPFIAGTYVDQVGSNPGPSNTPKNFTGNYYVRDYYGTQVASGTLTAQNSIALGSSLPCGWYKVFLTQSTNDATYGLAGGSGTFVVFPVDSRFINMVGQPLMRLRRNQTDASHIMRGALMHGPKRYVISNAELPDDPAGNPGDLTKIIGCIQNELNYYHQSAHLDPVRPRRTIVSFVANSQTTAGQAGVNLVVSTLCSTFGPDLFWFEGPANEPSGLGINIAANQAIFYAAVKAANASAMVIGPCPVSINAGTEPNNAGCMHYMSIRTPVPVEGMSFHAYNSVSGDLSLGRRSLTQWVADLTTNGLQNLPRFQTEQSYQTTEQGCFMSRFGARWDMLIILLCEQFGIPKEHFSLWYDLSAGFWAVPCFWQMDDMNLLPPPAMLRTMSAEVWGKTHVEAYDFGTPGNDMMLGSRYHDPNTLDDVIVLQAAGSNDLTVEFTVAGGQPSLTAVDCFGNTSTLTVTNNQVSVPTKMEPVYVRVPAGVTLTLLPKWTTAKLVRNVALGSIPSSTGTLTNQNKNIKRVINGVQDSGYYFNAASGPNDVHSPYFDDTGAYPASLTLTFKLAQRIDRVTLFASPPWQGQGTLLDFDIQTWNGTTWVTAATVTEPAVDSTVDDPTAVVFPFVDYSAQGGCTVHSSFSDRWIFDISFTAVTTLALRIYVRNATYGQAPTLTAWSSMVGDRTTNGNNFVIREIQVYDSDLAVPRYVLGP